MKMKFDVSYRDGSESVRVVAHPSAIVAWEKESPVNRITAEPSLTGLMKIAWYELDRPEGNFEKWTKLVDDFDPVGDEDDETPFGTPSSDV